MNSTRIDPVTRDQGDEMKVFLSYSRADAAVAAAVGEDVRQMGNAVWYDRELPVANLGGMRF